MTNEDIIKRLENVTLPDIMLESHRRELEASLLKEYASIQALYDRKGFVGWLRAGPSLWKSIHVSRKVWVVAVLIILALVTVLSLQVSGVFLSPSAIIAKAYAAIEKLESYRFIEDVYIQSLKNSELFEHLKIEFEYVDPDRYHMTIKSMGEVTTWGNYPKEVIAIGDRLYTRQYRVFSNTIESFNQMAPKTKEQTLEVLEILAEIETLPDEEIDGTDCYHYKGTVDMEKWLDWIRPSLTWDYERTLEMLPNFPKDLDEYISWFEDIIRAVQFSREFWFGKDDYLMRQWKRVAQTLPDTPPTGNWYKTVFIRKYYDFNEPIVIEPPLDESGELLEGWHISTLEE